jgi:hypothetical protein
MSIGSDVELVEAIREAVMAVRRDPRLRKRGWYDSHTIVNYLDAYRNEVLNRIIDLYLDCQDPPHRATIQIGCFLRDHLSQSKKKYGEGPSKRRITLRDGSRRDGKCSVSRWEISDATELHDNEEDDLGLEGLETLEGLDDLKE